MLFTAKKIELLDIKNLFKSNLEKLAHQYRQ